MGNEYVFLENVKRMCFFAHVRSRRVCISWQGLDSSDGSEQDSFVVKLRMSGYRSIGGNRFLAPRT